LEKKGKLLNKIFSDTSASNYRLSILVALLIFALLSVSAVLALTSTFQAPPNAQIWENTLMMLNVSTDFNANCSYNISDGTTDIIASLGTNDTTDQHSTNNIGISSLSEGSFDINVNCYNSSDGVLDSVQRTGTKDTAPPTVDWNTPSAESIHSLGSTPILLNVSANLTNSRGLDETKTDVFDITSCGGSLLNDPVYVPGVDGDTYILQNWTAGTSIAVNCTLKANVSTSMSSLWNQTERNVSVHPKCGDTLTASATLGLDLTSCAGNGLVINAASLTLDCNGHSISGDYSGAGEYGVSGSNDRNDFTMTGCTVYGFNGSNSAGVRFDGGGGSIDDNNISGNTFHSNYDNIMINAENNDLIISDNTFLNSSEGHVNIATLSTGIEISSNTMTYAGDDAIYVGCPGAEFQEAFIEDNTIQNSTGGEGSVGIHFDSCSNAGEDVTIEGNNISEFDRGIFVESGTIEVNITASNRIFDNDNGIDIQSNSNVLIWQNNIYNNNYDGVSSDAALQVSNGTHGNFWGHTTCPYFTSGVDTNASNVIDSYPYNETNGWDTHGPAAACLSCGDSISSDLTLTSDLVCNGDVLGLNITGNNVNLDCDGFAILGNGTDSSTAIEIAASVTGATIENCIISNFTEGIYMETGTSTIYSNTIENTTTALTLETSSDNTVVYENSFKYSSTGILLLDLSVGANINVTNNTITNNVNGVDAQNVDSSGGMVQMWYNDIHTNSGYDFLGDVADSNGGLALNYCDQGSGDCYGNYWGVSDHCPYFRQSNTNASYDNNGFWDDSAYASTRVGLALADPAECTVCGDTIEWDETLSDNIYNRTGGDTCYGDFAVELTQSDSALDCAGFTIKGSGSGVGVTLPNTTANNITVENCVIFGFTSSPNAAINLTAGDDHTFYNNTLSNNYYGIFRPAIGDKSGYNVTGNTILDSADYALRLFAVDDLIIDDNYIDDAWLGMSFVGGYGAITNNRINDTSARGIDLNSNDGSFIVTGNSINNSAGEGIHVAAVVDPSNFTNNDFYYNDVAIEFAASVTLGIMKVWHNNIIGSDTYGVQATAAMQVSNGTHGNFWGNTSCPFFVSGSHSSASNVIDSYPYNATDGWDTHSVPAPSCTIPTVELVTPAMEDVRMFNAFNFTVNVTDTANVQSVTIWNGTADQAMALTEGTATDGRWSAVVYLSSFTDGPVDLNISATNGGVANDTEQFYVIVDNTEPTVNLEWFEDNYNTTDNSDFFEFNASDDLYNDTRNMNCSWSIYNSTGTRIAFDFNSSVANETTTESIELLFASGEGDYEWNVTCYDMAMTNLNPSAEGNVGYSATYSFTYDTTPPTPVAATVDEADVYVSGHAPNQNITAVVSATDTGTGVSGVTANFSDITDNDADGFAMTSNGTHWTYTYSTDSTDTEDMEFEGANVTFLISDYAGNTNGALYTTVVMYNMTVPEADTLCIRYASGTTNFSEETDFADIDFEVNVDWYYSAACQYFGPGADNAYHRVARINFTGLDLSNQQTAEKLYRMDDAIRVSITPDANFGNSRIYINSSFFAELNTTATIALYNLPFDSLPNVTGDATAAGYDGATINYETYTHPTLGEVGNLTFNVDGFSGYNVSDIVDPIITVNSPSPNQTYVQGPTPLVNITVNGTGTQVSNLTLYVDAAPYDMDDMTCYNETGSEEMNCYFSPTVADGTRTLTINAWDYGGAAPGNNDDLIWVFTSDSTPPLVTNNQSNATSIVTDDTVIVLNVTASDTTNVSNVTANGVLMGNTTNTGYNLTTTPAALGCTESGTCTVTFNATDYFGNYNDSKVTTFTVDVGPPTVTGVSVTNATNVSSAVAVNLQANVVDPASTVSVTANGQTMYLLSGSATSGVWHANLTAGNLGCSSDAVCTITINATDSLGNYNDTETTTYYVDDTNPAVTSVLNNGTEVKSATGISVNATVTDLSNVTSVITNNSVALTHLSGNNWGVVTTPTALGCAANALCTIGITATDMAGNANNTETTTVTVDNTAPVVAFTYNNTAVNSSTGSFTLNVTVTEANTNASIKANNLHMTQVGATTTWTVTDTGTNLGCTSSGSCTVTYVANDTAGNSGSTTSTLTIDNDGPAVTGLSVTNATREKNSTGVNIQATVSDSPAGVSTVTVNGNTMYLMSGTTYYANRTGVQLGCGPEGTCTLTVTATDAFGNANATATTTYVIDETAPTNTSAFSASASSSSATITSTFGEAVKCTVEYGTNTSTMGSSSTSASFVTTGSVSISSLSASTTYYYNVTSCVDQAGNTNTMNYGPFNFTTSATTTNTGGGGGGGSGGSTTTNYDVGDLTGGISDWNLGSGDSVSFGHSGDDHSVKALYVGKDYAELEVMSSPQTFRLYIGQSRAVDLDGDTKADINVKLLDIIAYKALVKVESLVDRGSQIKLLPPAKRTPRVEPEPEVVETVQETAVEPAAPEPAAEPAADMLPEPTEVTEDSRVSWYWYAFIGLVLVVALVLLLIFIFEKRKPGHGL